MRSFYFDCIVHVRANSLEEAQLTFSWFPWNGPLEGQNIVDVGVPVDEPPTKVFGIYQSDEDDFDESESFLALRYTEESANEFVADWKKINPWIETSDTTKVYVKPIAIS